MSSDPLDIEGGEHGAAADPEWFRFALGRLRAVERREDVPLGLEMAPGLTVEEAIGGIAAAHVVFRELAQDLAQSSEQSCEQREDMLDYWRLRLSELGYGGADQDPEVAR